MLRQMWKKRVCFVLAVILAVIAVTPMEMEHTDAKNGTFGNSIDDGKSGKQVQCGQADLQTAGDKRL